MQKAEAEKQKSEEDYTVHWNNGINVNQSLPTGAFAPSRNSGISASNAVLDERMTCGVGAFYGDTDDDGDSDFNDDTNLNMTLRLTGLPYYADEGRRLLHLGLGYSHQFRDEGKTTARFLNRPESHLTDVRLVDMGSIAPTAPLRELSAG
jgi:phosphate-selective porin OprO/OprP